MRTLVLAVLLGAAFLALAQQAPAPAPALDVMQLCLREFGDQFKPDPKYPPVALDLDGDGQEDLVMVVTGKNPLSGEIDHHYRVIDPYDAYFGYGDPKITLQFSATNVGVTHYVLVVHNWRAPKAKFVIINLPFDRLEPGRIAVKKNKAVNSLHAVESGGLASDVFWDGKKYRWAPSYFQEQQP